MIYQRNFALEAVFLGALVLALCTTALSAQSSQTTNYYVDALNGRDIAQAGSLSSPWKTLPYAMSRIPNQVGNESAKLHLASGHPHSVSAAVPLRDKIYLTGDSTTASVVTATHSGPILTMTGAEYVAIRDLNFVGGSSAMLCQRDGNNSYGRVLVYDCTFANQRVACIDTKDSIGFPWVEFQTCTFSNAPIGIRATLTDGLVTLQVKGGNFFDLSKTAIEWVAPSGKAYGTLTVVDSIFRRCGNGLIALASNHAAGIRSGVLLENCAFRDIAQYGIGVSIDAYLLCQVRNSTFARIKDGLTIESSTGAFYNQLLVESNYFVDCSNSGIDIHLDDAASPVGLWTMTSLHNTVVDCGRNIRFAIGSNIRGTFVSDGDTSHASAAAALELTNASPSCNSTLQNPILTRSNSGVRTGGSGPVLVQFATLADMRGPAIDGGDASAVIENCILDNAVTPELVRSANLTIRGCCSKTTQLPGSKNFVAAPQLIRPYYKLAGTSPCIDRAIATNHEPQADYEGDSRIVTTTVAMADLGADEFRPSGSVRNFGARCSGSDGSQGSLDVVTDSAKIGNHVEVRLTRLEGYWLTFHATGGLFLVGFGDGDSALDLDAFLANGCMLYIKPLVVSPWTAATNRQYIPFKVQIPNVASLVDTIVSIQGLMFNPMANEAGFLASNGVRITIGQ